MAASSKAVRWRQRAAAGVSRSSVPSCARAVIIEHCLVGSTVTAARFGRERDGRRWRKSPVINQFRKRRNVRIGTVDGIDHDRLVFGYFSQNDLAPHEFAAGNLTLLQRH